MSIPKDIIKNNISLDDWAILTGYRGSIAHGMYIPNKDPNSIDDKDAMSVCLPPLGYYFGLEQFGSKGTKEIFVGEWDIVIYELRKFVSLLQKCNPNVLGLLWLKPNQYMKVTETGQMLLNNRDLFTSKIAYHSFVGYATSQLKKMTAFTFNGYMGEKRKALVTKYGYDTKNAAHLIRLLRMGCEFLNEGRLIVERPDASELLDIKTGKWSLDQVKLEAVRLRTRIDTAYDNCKLPNEPDYKSINELLINMNLERIS